MSYEIENRTYERDGLITKHNCDFLADADFVSAYERGVKAAGVNYAWHWRVHIGLWAAKTALKVAGDYVEFGVNAGFMSSAIMHHLDWNSQDRKFYLLDTFSGIDTSLLTSKELEAGAKEKNTKLRESGFYVTSMDRVKENFSEWPAAIIVQGSIPNTLTEISSERFAFVHIDLNNATPEVAALSFVWNKLSLGGVVLLDDYAYDGYDVQKEALDNLAQELDFHIASLPTGQGLIVKN